MKRCPNCKSRATKIVNLSKGTYTCQVCGHEWEIPNLFDPDVTKAIQRDARQRERMNREA